MPNTKIGTTWAPDIRPENIETFEETYVPEGGEQQTATYRSVDHHPILNKVLDKLAFFRTHAGAVWYNLQERKTLLAKLNEQDAVIEGLNAKIPVTQEDLLTFHVNVDIRGFSACRTGNIINFYMSILPERDLTDGEKILTFKSPYIPKVTQVFPLRLNRTPYPEVATLWAENGVGTLYGNITKGTVYIAGSFVF
ncbi:MAG: hypothetical protein HFI29_05445 [Lachnospiraceae bacterium]|jgi:hypothetical protein|nr:hypothetical protein [Lachnospiraceae bacterium]